jgi:hypothetical protein
VQFPDPSDPEKLHASHVEHTVDPLKENRPALHTPHVPAETAPLTLLAVPAGHAWQELEFAPLNLPAGHTSQVKVTPSPANFL